MLQSVSEKNKHIAIGAALGIFFTLSTTAIVLATKTRRHESKKSSSTNNANNTNGQTILLKRSGTTIVKGGLSGATTTTTTTTTTAASSSTASTRISTNRTSEIADGIAGLIGNTPMIRIKSLSDATGCEILAKAEFLNPGGSTKDRVALSMVNTAEQNHVLTPGNGSTIFEGTVGSTGISLAMIAKARGYNAWIVMPDDVALEKSQLLEKLGAHVEKVRPVSIVDKNQFVRLAQRRAQEFGTKAAAAAGASSSSASSSSTSLLSGTTATGELPPPTGFFADQFENLANFQAHFTTTGPEIYNQTEGQLDAIVMGAGTGGTLAGVAKYLKARVPEVRTYLVDPQGSGLFNKVKYNTMYASTEKEGRRKRHQVDTVVEGVGINRLTRNFEMAEGLIDDAIRVSDQEAVDMARFLVHNDGIFIGSSSAVNCVGAVRIARELGPGHTIVTLLCDSGQRHLTKFWNDEYLESQGLEAKEIVDSLDFIV